MNPLALWILYTYESIPGEQPGCRAYLFADQASAQACGEKLQVAKPAEVQTFTFMVLPLEGAPA